MAVHAEIIGDQELIKELKALAHPNSFGDRIQKKLLEGAIGLRDKIRAAAPLGKPHPQSVFGKRAGTTRMVGGGALRRGIVAKKYKYYTPGNPAVFVAIDMRIAPHAYLVEYGARQSGTAIAVPGFFRGYLTGRKALKFWSGTGRSGGKMEQYAAWAKPGPMPAHPFFAPTVERNRRILENYITLCVLEQLKWNTANFDYLGMQ